ncbi:MAG: hypothetical protein Q9171_007294 [Xanthocarpia ochracea]
MSSKITPASTRKEIEMQDIPTHPKHAIDTQSRLSVDDDESIPDIVEKLSIQDEALDMPLHQAHVVRSSSAYMSEEEQAVIKRFDRHLVLFIAFLYMLGFLDRSNIGNAKIAGMSNDLHLTSSQYEWVLRSFYITYVLFEWMPILYTVLSPSTYIALCVLAWGAIASSQALVTSYTSLCFLRALLGISEAAFGPGVPVFLAFFYKQDELAFRIGLFISAAPLATSVASSLAWLITKLGRDLPIAPWRMLFLVEGFPSVIVSIFAFYRIPNSPGKAKFLSQRERRIAKLRLAKGKPKAERRSDDRKLKWNEIWEALADPKCYLTAVANVLLMQCRFLESTSLPTDNHQRVREFLLASVSIHSSLTSIVLHSEYIVEDEVYN